MNPIEKAIRAALEKGDAEDRAHREKVYRTVFAAVERTIAARPDMGTEAIAERRALLRESIRSVESEFVAAAAPAEPVEAAAAPKAAEPAPPVATRQAAAREAPEVAPEIAVERGAPGRAAARGAPEIAMERQRREAGFAGPEDAPDPLAEGWPRAAPRMGRAPTRAPRRRGKLFAALFLGATLVAALGIGAWWIADQGLLRPAAERDGAVPNPPPLLEDEAFDPEDRPPLQAQPDAAAARENWIVVFDPEDVTVVTATAGASAEVVATDTGPALRIRSADAEAAVLFDVGQGILERIAGRPALFNIVASAGDGGATQISVTCNLAELGGCGRNRYNVAQDRGDFLFERDLPNASPGAAGTLAITSDVEGEGRPVDIYAIRVSVER